MKRLPSLVHSLSCVRSIVPEAFAQVIDVGAQRQTDFLMRVFPDRHHHLFEPVATYHEDLERNYRQAGIAYTLYPCALGGQAGTLYLHNTSGDGSGRITHSYIEETAKPDLPKLVGIQEIEVKTLDEVFAGSKRPNLDAVIKLDVDGLEEQIIDAGKETIAHCSFVVIEASLGRMNIVSRTELIQSLGFRLFDIADPAYYFGQLAQVDLVFVNTKLRNAEIKLRPWQYTEGLVKWKRWQHEVPDGKTLYVPDFGEDD